MTTPDNSCDHANAAAGPSWRPGQPVVPGVSRRNFLHYTALGSAAAAAAVGASGGVEREDKEKKKGKKKKRKTKD